jgi:transposase-like protein
MKKHSHQEILLKLDQAAELSRAGKSQVEVCRALGISVMTFHRWRRLPPVAKVGESAPAIVPAQSTRSEPSEDMVLSPGEMARLLEELTVENRRLRKIVTDLLLEKTRLEVAVAARQPIAAAGKTMADAV